jgi:FAD:protein FMN transferase
MAVALACASAPHSHAERGRYAMGTLLEITLHGSDAATLARARDAVSERIDALDARMSRFASESDVSRLNRRAGGAPLAVDPAVRDILGEAVRMATLTRGAFDVSVGPLVDLWVRAAADDALPGPDALADARARVGVDGIRIAADGRVALRAGTSIDLGGLAKGYALDCALRVLAAHGVESALLNFGQSSLWALGRPPDALGWRLLVRAPQGGFAGVIVLRDQALSVSGSLGQWSEIAGRRFGHVLDPRSGWPLTRRREALVVAPTATLAEALSTALLVLGETEGIALVQAQPGCEALLLDADGGHWETSRWTAVTHYAALSADAG